MFFSVRIGGMNMEYVFTILLLFRGVSCCHITEIEYNWSLGADPVEDCLEYKVRYSGIVIKEMNVEDYAYCQANCAIINECIGFTFVEKSPQNDTDCQLFSFLSGTYNITGFTSGPPKCTNVTSITIVTERTLYPTTPNQSLPITVPPEFCKMIDTELTGKPVDIKDEKGKYGVVDDFLDCHAACLETPGCNYFTLDLDKNCFLKRFKGNVIQKKGYQSGKRVCNKEDPEVSGILPYIKPSPCIEKDLTYKGYPLYRVEMVASSGKVEYDVLCQQMCKDHPECKYFVYSKKSGDCYLKSQMRMLKVSQEHKAGPKVCDTDDTGCFLDDVFFLGYDIQRVQIQDNFGKLETVYHCQVLCRKIKGCVWFNYDADRICYLLSTKTEYTTFGLVGYQTGPPNCATKYQPSPKIPPKDSRTCIEKDVSYVGFAILLPGSTSTSYKSTNSAEDCQAECRRTTACRWFNYKKKKCYMNYLKGFKMYRKGVQSGPPSCNATHTILSLKDQMENCISRGISHDGLYLYRKTNNGHSVYYPEGNTPLKCQKVCAKESRCVWFHFDYRMRCSLLSFKREANKTSPGYFSGPPNCDKLSYKPPSIPALVDDCMEQDVQYVGFDLLNVWGMDHYMAVNSASECKEKCKMLDGCKWFNYNTNLKLCYTKRDRGLKEYHEGIQSGDPNCQPRPDYINQNCMVWQTHYAGVPLYSVHKYDYLDNIQSAVYCQNLCQEEEHCLWFKYDSVTGECWLQADSGKPESQTIWIRSEFQSGPKYCTGGGRSCFLKNLEHSGPPIYRSSISDNFGYREDPRDCQEICQKTSDCVWFNYNKNKTCTLLSARFTWSTRRNYHVGGPPSCSRRSPPQIPALQGPDESCIETNVKYVGFDLKEKLNIGGSNTSSNMLKNLADVEDCRSICKNTEECRWFNYDELNQLCDLHYRKGFKIYKKNSKSGPKVCGDIGDEPDEKEIERQCIETDVNYRGMFIWNRLSSHHSRYHPQVSSAIKCQELCKEHPAGCVWFVFDDRRRCSLLSYVYSDTTHSPGFYAGPPYCQDEFIHSPDLKPLVDGCIEQDISYFGYELMNYTTNKHYISDIQSVDECKSICKNTKGCGWFSYYNRNCSLFEVRGLQQYQPGFQAGFPYCLPPPAYFKENCIEASTSYTGTPIYQSKRVYKITDVDSLQMCQQYCKDLEACKEYQFQQEPAIECSLVADGGDIGVLFDLNHKVGPKKCKDGEYFCEYGSGIFSPFADYVYRTEVDDNFGRMDSPLDCQKTCEKTESCVWFNFAEDGTCTLLSEKLTRQTKPNHAGGPPSCAKRNISNPESIKTDLKTCIESDLNYVGFDIFMNGSNSTGGILDAEGCQTRCAQVKDCGWFVFKEKECLLKYRIGYKHYSKGVKAGPPSCTYVVPTNDPSLINELCILPDLSYTGAYLWRQVGKGYSMYYPEGQSARKCQALCAKTIGCVWFVFDYRRKCSLLSYRHSAPTAHLGFQTGPPSCDKKKYAAPILPAPVSSCIEQDFVYLGEALTSGRAQSTVQTVLDCKDLCSRSSGCGWYNFDSIQKTCFLWVSRGLKEYRKGFQTGDPACELKDDPYIANCMERDVYYTGLLLYKTSTKGHVHADNQFVCQAMCLDNAECEKFVFYRSSSACILTAPKEDEGLPDDDVVSGPKTCGGDSIEKCFGNFSYGGSELLHTKVYQNFGKMNDALDCQERCKQEVGCVGFSYHTDNTCHLLSAVMEKKEGRGELSGPPSCEKKMIPQVDIPHPDWNSCIEKDVEYIGYDIYQSPGIPIPYTELSSVEECRTACQNNAECRWFNFDRKLCYLKYSRGYKSYAKNVQSGPPNCTMKDTFSPEIKVRCIEKDVTYEGLYLWKQINQNSYSIVHEKDTSPDKCQDLCAKTKGCVWFVLDFRRDCYFLSHRIRASTLANGYLSGPPSCERKNYRPPKVSSVLECELKNITYLGYDIETVTAASYEECQEKCHEKESKACRGYSYKPAEGRCYLKAQNAFPQFESSTKSGRMECYHPELCVEESTFYKGLPLLDTRSLSTYESVQSPLNCQTLCMAEDECNQFEYRKSRHACILKNAQLGGGVTQFSFYVSGPKFCGEKNLKECYSDSTTLGTELYRTVFGREFTLLKSIAHCQNRCRQIKGCVWYNFVAPDECFLLSSVLGKERRIGSASGPTNCSKKSPEIIPMPQPDPQYCIEKNVNYVGFDIYRTPGSSNSEFAEYKTVQDCQTACSKLPDCRWFDYKDNECFLKYSRGFRVYVENAQSGPPKCGELETTYEPDNEFCIMLHVRYEGLALWKSEGQNKYNIAYEEFERAEDCQRLCSQTSRCIWFNFDYKKRCYLLSYRSTTPIYDAGYYSGPPSCERKAYKSPFIPPIRDCMATNIVYFGEFNGSISPTSEVASVQECKDKCKSVRECNCFSYRTANRTCYLKTQCYYEEYQTGTLSGDLLNC